MVEAKEAKEAEAADAEAAEAPEAADADAAEAAAERRQQRRTWQSPPSESVEMVGARSPTSLPLLKPTQTSAQWMPMATSTPATRVQRQPIVQAWLTEQSVLPQVAFRSAPTPPSRLRKYVPYSGPLRFAFSRSSAVEQEANSDGAGEGGEVSRRRLVWSL